MTSKSTRVLTPEQKEFYSMMLARAVSDKYGQPWLAPAYYALKPVNSPGLKTEAMDRWGNVYVDFDWIIETKGQDEGLNWAGLVLNHELWHFLRNHSARYEELRDESGAPKSHKLWNYAGDMEINDDLWFMPEGRQPLIPADGLIPEIGQLAKYKRGDFAENYYRLLREDPEIGKPQDKGDESGNCSGDCQGSQEDGDGSGGNCTCEQEGKGSGKGSGSGKGGKGQPGQGGGGRQGDEPADLGGESGGNCGSGAGNEETLGDWALDEGDARGKGLSEVEQEIVREEVAERIQKGHGIGNAMGIPGSIREWADNYLLEKPVDWRRELRSTMSLIIGNSRRGRADYSYIRPSRRQPVKGVIMPGMIEPTTRLCLGSDTSGSNLGNLQLIAEEAQKISKQLGIRGKDFSAFAVDVSVDKMRPVNNPKHIFDDQRIGGGTRMRPAYEFVAGLKGEKRPNVFLLATDGEVADFPTEPVPGIKGIKVVTAIIMTGQPNAPHNVQTWENAKNTVGRWSKVIALYNVGQD
jgi:predicted metal-dependent peptidase